MNNEPGREPTEPTDADIEAIEWAVGYGTSGWKFVPTKKLIMACVRQMSGQRPMPQVNSDRNCLKNIASWANRGVTITAMPGGAFVDDAGNLSGICVTGLPDTPAPDEVAQLRQELRDCETVCGRLAFRLDSTATALKGDPGPLKGHSFHDLPEIATALSARVAVLEAELVRIVAWCENPSNRTHHTLLQQCKLLDDLRLSIKLPLSAPGKEPTSE